MGTFAAQIRHETSGSTVQSMQFLEKKQQPFLSLAELNALTWAPWLLQESAPSFQAFPHESGIGLASDNRPAGGRRGQ